MSQQRAALRQEVKKLEQELFESRRQLLRALFAWQQAVDPDFDEMSAPPWFDDELPIPSWLMHAWRNGYAGWLVPA